jgi:glycosyltransferase involved in cell wall biosynthesis
VSGLRFAFLTTFYPPYNFGGDGVGIQRLARGLVRAGHHVTVVHDADAFNVLRRGPEPAPVPEIPGIEVVTLKTSMPLFSALATQQTGRPIFNGSRIRRLLAEGAFDVINYHNSSLIGGPGLWRYGDALKVFMAHEHWLVCPTHVLWRHGRELCTGRQCVRCQLRYDRPPQLWRMTGFLEREARHIDAFIAMSEFSRAKHAEFGFPYPMEVVPYFLENTGPVGPEQVVDASPHPRPYFLFVGRLEKIKGLDHVIPLFRDYSEADLLVAGDGDYAATLRQAARGLDRVKFLGRIPLDQLSRYYAHALGLIVPSLCFETFGIIIIEAFQQGTPVIARRLGPFPELIETSGGGLLFDRPDELVEAMQRLVREPGLRARLSGHARKAFEAHWSERVVVPRYLDVVRRAAERTGRHELAERLTQAADLAGSGGALVGWGGPRQGFPS